MVLQANRALARRRHTSGRRFAEAMCAALIVGSALSPAAAFGATPGDWPTLGGDPGGMRYSTLAQITPANVARLQIAWVYHLKPTGDGNAAAEQSAAQRAQAQAEQLGPGGPPPPGAPRGAGGFGPGGPFAGAHGLLASESVPLVIAGTMYLVSPYSRIVALDASTGKEQWVHEIPNKGRAATRGLEYWPGDGTAPPALLFGTADGKLHSIRASDGMPSAGFGDGGIVDLKTPEVMVTGLAKPYFMASPPIVYRNLVLTGASVGEAVGGAVGDVRAWDARTGKLVWTFHSVPRKGEPGYESWANDSGHDRSGTNVWGLMTVDATRGIAYLPFGAPTSDRVGVDRPGNNLYSSSVVAVNAATGRYLWHFQIVHHDIWDNDAETPPTLFDVHRGGKTIPAVGFTSKNGLFFILDRVTGKPIYGVEERAVPPSDVPGEMASPTQPFPVRPAPLARMSMRPDEVSTVTPEHEAFCRKLIADNGIAMGGPYNPPTFNRAMVYFPGTIGALFGGAIDPKLGLYVVNVHSLAQVMQIVPDGRGGFSNNGPANGRFWDPKTRLECQSGSWGDMVAVNVNTGEIAWRSRQGVSDTLPPGKQETGRPSTGGPIVTAGGLTFAAGTDDGRFRAYDTRTGKEVWTVKLPASAHTNPIAYGTGGRQYVAIVATGGSFLGTPVTSDSLIAYTLK